MHVSLLTNMVAPYRVPLFKALAADERIKRLRILTCVEREVDRQWQIAPQSDYTVKRLEGITINLHLGSNALRILHLRWGIIWELLRHRPDRLIIGDASWTSYLGMLFCLLLRVPYVVWNEITIFSKVSSGLMSVMRRLLYRYARACIASGRLAREFLLSHGCDETKIVIALNAIDNDFFIEQRSRWELEREEIRHKLGVAPKAFALLYVGQLITRKRVMETLEAAALVSREFDLHLIIVGRGPLEEQLRRRSAELDFQSLTFCGYVEPSDLSRIYVASDGLILLSKDEPWGMVINEALLFGKPYFASIEVAAAAELNFWKNNHIVNQQSTIQQELLEFAVASSSQVPLDLTFLPAPGKMASIFAFSLEF